MRVAGGAVSRVDRREFLAAMLWLGAARLAEPDAALLLPRATGAGGDDEAYWRQVRAAFEHTEGQTNLVTVVRGVTPRAVRTAVEAESARLNAFRPRDVPDPEWKTRVRGKAAALIGAEEREVALVRNTTEGVATVLGNWPLGRGDEILTSGAEHGPFYDLLAHRAARDGVVPRTFALPAPAPSLGTIVEAVERAMTPRTRLVMIGQVVLTGQIMPVREIADVVHRGGAHLLVDGVLAVGHVPVDVRAMDCDFFAAGFHKWGCGPRATAVFHVRPGLAERLAPLFGAVDDDGTRLTPLWSSSRMAKYESFGAHPDAHFHALERSLDFLREIGQPRIQHRLHALTRRWLDRAERLPGFRAAVANDPRHVAGLVAWEYSGDRERLRTALRAARVLVGGTEPYAGFFGIPANRGRSLTVTNTALFTSPADVDAFAGLLERTLR